MKWVPKKSVGEVVFEGIEDILGGKVTSENQTWKKFRDEHGNIISYLIYKKKLELEFNGEKVYLTVGHQNTDGSVVAIGLEIDGSYRWFLRIESYLNGVDVELSEDLYFLRPTLQALSKKVKRNESRIDIEDFKKFIRKITYAVLGYYLNV